MSYSTIVGFLVLAVMLTVVLWVAITGRRSFALGILACVLAAVSALGAWYSWAESHSIPWAAGYGAIFAISVIGAGRQFMRR